MIPPCKVSVIIPTYNRAHTIGEAIKSVLNQSFGDFELIVVDDGSTDGTNRVIRSFGDPRIREISHTNNQGPAAARNTGLKQARGAYLAFLDSDDVWLPEKLARQVELLEGLPPEWGMSCTAFYLVEEWGEMLIRRPPDDLSRALLETCDYGPGTTLVVRRECLDRVGELDERLERLEDWDWLLRISRYYRMAYVEAPLARVFKTGFPSAEATERATLRFLLKHQEIISHYGAWEKRCIFSRHYFRLAHYLYLERRFFRGSRYLLRALVNNPFQNPLRFVGVVQSGIDGLLGTRLASKAIHIKRRYLHH